MPSRPCPQTCGMSPSSERMEGRRGEREGRRGEREGRRGRGRGEEGGRGREKEGKEKHREGEERRVRRGGNERQGGEGDRNKLKHVKSSYSSNIPFSP